MAEEAGKAPEAAVANGGKKAAPAAESAAPAAEAEAARAAPAAKAEAAPAKAPAAPPAEKAKPKAKEEPAAEKAKPKGPSKEPSHKLQHEWSIWEHRKQGKHSMDYANAMYKLCTFGTVEDFWRYYNAIPSPSKPVCLRAKQKVAAFPFLFIIYSYFGGTR